MVSRLGDLAEETKTNVYAWVLMSNHMHILLKSGLVGLSMFMRRLLTGYAVTYNTGISDMGMFFKIDISPLSAMKMCTFKSWSDIST